MKECKHEMGPENLIEHAFGGEYLIEISKDTIFCTGYKKYKSYCKFCNISKIRIDFTEDTK